jgi:murein L,D-transpeptidase YcbB/YkuD
MPLPSRLAVCCAVLTLLCIHLASCDDAKPPKPKKVAIVREPEKLAPSVSEQIRLLVENAVANKGKADDSIRVHQPDILEQIYDDNKYQRIWSKDKEWLPVAGDFLIMVRRCEEYGLFPSDQHRQYLINLFARMGDSVSLSDAALWARGDLLLTDAFISFARQLKVGRIPRDSISLNKDSLPGKRFYQDILNLALTSGDPRSVLEALEPKHEGYLALKAALPRFLDSMDRTTYTYIEFPKTDSLLFVKQLQARLFENSYITFNTRMPDSVELSQAVTRAQQARGLKVDGKAGPQLVNSLNNTGLERFRRIAINMDRYKHLPDSMPQQYIWVNLPAYKLQVYDSGIVVLESKVIVGQPRTRTPVLTSEVSNFITYPQWTVPYSIIFKEMLPKIQKNVNYLAKENLMVVDKNDSVIDPHTINWSKLSKTNFPYLFRQRQGDDNSLGVMKFNFRNKYSVYLHDTNARSLFSRPSRALSHGCVRVQGWDSLSRYLLARDTTNTPVDSVRAWLSRQEKKTVSLRKRVPLFLRYFTCEVREDGGIRFFEDIYGEDKVLRVNYFSRV